MVGGHDSLHQQAVNNSTKASQTPPGIIRPVSRKPHQMQTIAGSYTHSGNENAYMDSTFLKNSPPGAEVLPNKHVNFDSSKSQPSIDIAASPRNMLVEDPVAYHHARPNAPPRPVSDMAIRTTNTADTAAVPGPLLSPESAFPVTRQRTNSTGNLTYDSHLKRLSLENARKLMGSPSPHDHHSFYQTLYHTPSQHHHGLPLDSFDMFDSDEIEGAAAVSIERLENLQEMRSQYLIGKSGPLRDWSLYVKSKQELKSMSSGLREFYEKQNELLERYMAIDKMLDSGLSLSMLRVYGDDHGDVLTNVHGDGAHTPVGRTNVAGRQGVPANIDETTALLGGSKLERSNTVMFAIYVNFVINFLLLVGKTAVALLTNSLSIVASLVDSALDFLSTFIIWVSTRLVDQRDWKTKHLYPVGRSRLEPIGVLVFSIIIIVSFLKIADEAVQQLWRGWMYNEGQTIVNLGIPSIIIMVLTILVKVFCWVWCRSIDSSAVQALAQDAMTDIIFNFFSLMFPLLEHYTHQWWLDPLGALVLSCYIIYSWGCTALEHIINLTGSAADPSDRQVVLYLGFRFAECVKYITALNAYHAGDRITVEIDIILSESLKLKDSHDIAESLQYAIETLPFVERAFVHLDYRTGNFAGHLDR